MPCAAPDELIRSGQRDGCATALSPNALKAGATHFVGRLADTNCICTSHAHATPTPTRLDSGRSSCRWRAAIIPRGCSSPPRRRGDRIKSSRRVRLLPPCGHGRRDSSTRLGGQTCARCPASASSCGSLSRSLLQLLDHFGVPIRVLFPDHDVEHSIHEQEHPYCHRKPLWRVVVGGVAAY